MTDSPPAPPAPAAAPTRRPTRGRAIAARILVILGILLPRHQPALELRQARGARQGQLPEHVGGADRERRDPRPDRVDDGGRRSTRTSTSRASSRSSCRRTCSASRGRSPASRATPPIARRARCSTGRACRSSSWPRRRRRSSSSSKVLEDKTRRWSTRRTGTSFSTSGRSCSGSATDSSSSQPRPADPAGLGAGHAAPVRPARDRAGPHAVAQGRRELDLDARDPVLGALAIWLVPGRRRREVRAIGIGLVVTGVLLLVIRSLAGNYIVDKVVVTESVKPAVNEAWDIITDGLAASAWRLDLGRRAGGCSASGSPGRAGGARRPPGAGSRRTCAGPRSPGRASRSCSSCCSGCCRSRSVEGR